MPRTYKTHDLNLSDTSKDRLISLVESRAQKKAQAKQERSETRFERFKAVFTNKEVKTAIKNAGKEFKAIGDMASKTIDTTSSSVKGFGQGAGVIGAGAQFVETGVDIYLAKQKVKKAKTDLSTVKRGTDQLRQELALKEQIVDKLNERKTARAALRRSEKNLAKQSGELKDQREELAKQETEIAKMERQLRMLDENMRSVSRGRHIGDNFLKEQQTELTDRLSSATTGLQQLEKAKINTLAARQETITRMQGQLRVLEENIQIAPQHGIGTSFLEEERQRVSKELSAMQDSIPRVERMMDEQIEAQRQEVSKIEGQLLGLDENLRAISQKSELPSTSFLQKEHDRVSQRLSTARSGLQQLKGEITEKEKQVRGLEWTVQRRQKRVDQHSDGLKKMRSQLSDLQSKDKLKLRMARKDLDQYNDDIHLERAKLMKSLLDGANSVGTVVNVGLSTAGEVVKEGAKLGGGAIGVIAGPVTFGVNTKDFINDVKGNRDALKLKHKASNLLADKNGIKQDDTELLAIAERLHLKQKKNSVDKGLSATKNFFGALGGLGTAASGGAAIALAVGGAAAAATAAAAVLTPVGWALAGAAAAAAIGYGIYKIARHINSQAIKEALQTTLLKTNNEPGDKKLSELQGLTKKEAKALDKVASKAVKALAQQGIQKEKGDLTVDELQNYASKKLLARDTGVATQALYARFKEEVTTHLNGRQPTKENLESYIRAEAHKQPVDSAVGLLSKLGVGLKGEEALDLYRDKSTSDGIKFLSKKIYSAQKDGPSKQVSVRDQVRPNGNGLHNPGLGEKQGGKLRESFQRGQTPSKKGSGSLTTH